MFESVQCVNEKVSRCFLPSELDLHRFESNEVSLLGSIALPALEFKY